MSSLRRIELRPATEEDKCFLWWLHQATLKDAVDQTWGWDDEDQQERFEHRFNPLVVQIVVIEGEDVGMIQVERTKGMIRLNNIQIAPRRQRQGIGSALIQALLQEGREVEVPMWLRVLRVNPARALYERLGFRIVGETETHYQMVADFKEQGTYASRRNCQGRNPPPGAPQAAGPF